MAIVQVSERYSYEICDHCGNKMKYMFKCNLCDHVSEGKDYHLMSVEHDKHILGDHT